MRLSRRVWLPLAIGTVVGGAAVLGFAPVVRGQIADKAARYGAAVEVTRVTPSFGGVRLRGVELSFDEIPGVTVSVDDMVVGWWDRRPRSLSGGKITAVGEVKDLVAAVELWRERHLSQAGSGSSGGGGELLLDGLELSWVRAADDPDQSIRASGLRVRRAAGVLEAEAASLTAAVGPWRASVEGGRLELRRADGGYRVETLSSESLLLSYERPKAPSPAVGDEAETQPAVHQRVIAARAARAGLLAAAARADAWVADDASITVNGARAKIVLGDDSLNLGPGQLRVLRDAGDLVIALEPSGEQADGNKTLTFSFRVPIRDGDAPVGERPIEGQLRGGPVWLSMLGVQNGDMGMRDVEQASLEADVRIVLPPDGSAVSVDGRGKVLGLSLESQRLAPTPLAGIELAWRAKLDARLDGSQIVVHDAEVDLGELRSFFKGRVDRVDDGTKVDIDFELPLVTCQRVFESLPSAMVPDLSGMHFVGSLGASGHVRFDTHNLARDYDVAWDGSLGCRVVDVPPQIDVRRFTTPFDKRVYGPNKQEQSQQFGPGTDDWVPIGSISRFMPSAVLCTEDGRFFRHAGFDQEAIVNSIRENLKEKRFVRGASTISMQLAKNLYLPRNKTIARKLQEAILTMYLEQALTKDEMMELYLNIIEYAPDVYGIGPAARHYFNTSASSLSLGQSLYLASILANPNKQYFGSGGAVIGSRMTYLRTLMKIVHKIGRISDEELDVGLRETVVFGSASLLAPPEEDVYEGEAATGVVDPWAG